MEFPKVSVIIIHYNRIEHLKSTINTLLFNLNYPNIQLIIADDCSKPEIREELLNINCDILVLNQQNFGLGKNTNNALKLCSGKYILQLQDDWDFIGDINMLKDSIKLFDNDENIDLIRYYNTSKYPYKNKYLNNKFYEVNYHNLNESLKNTLYSDTPHLKRNDFHLKYGFFKENVPMTKMELEFAENYALKRTGKVFFTLSDYFIHTGEDATHNPFQLKMRKINKLKGIPLLGTLVILYLSARRFLVNLIKERN